MDALTPGQEDAQRRVHELLAELAEIIGPAGDGQTAFELGEEPSGTTLWEWVVVGCWVDDDRQDWVTVLPAAGMLNHHVVGLLRAGLAFGRYEDAAGGEVA